MNDAQERDAQNKANKDLFDQVEFGHEVIAFCNSPVGKYLIGRAEMERDEAITELRDIRADDMVGIMALQSKIRRAEGMQGWMAEAIQNGVSAQEELLAQDRANTNEAD